MLDSNPWTIIPLVENVVIIARLGLFLDPKYRPALPILPRYSIPHPTSRKQCLGPPKAPAKPRVPNPVKPPQSREPLAYPSLLQSGSAQSPARGVCRHHVLYRVSCASLRFNGWRPGGLCIWAPRPSAKRAPWFRAVIGPSKFESIRAMTQYILRVPMVKASQTGVFAVGG